MCPKEKTILYVDDDADDRDLLGEIMQKVSPELKVMFAENGLHALELLDGRKDAKFRPCLIVLDLNMPYLNGRQTFERIKADIQLKNIPVVILTSGESPADKSFFSKQSIPYFIKPVKLSDMESLANELTTYCEEI
jgi:CheY-like chemotaxis protein